VNHLLYLHSIMEQVVTVEELSRLVKSGKTYAEISKILTDRYPSSRGFSQRSVRRFCHDNKIDKKSLLGKEKLDSAVREEVLEVGIT